jgi:LysM domain
MPSLTAHLRQPEDHSGLPFHPNCPVCRRDRLAGSLTGDELVSRRTQATIAAGLLAFTGVGAPAAIASDPDTVSEGTAEVVEDAGPDSFDVGGDTVQLTDEATPTPEVAAPPADATVPSADDEDSAALETTSASDDVAPASVVSDDPAAPPGEAPPESDPVTPQPVDTPTVSTAANGSGIRSEPSKRLNVVRERPAKTVAQVVVSAEPAAPVVAPASTAPRTVRVLAGTKVEQATSGDRFHTVRRGESLWSIASDLLGEGASVSSVAREVSRLWELNDNRIGTGSPDVLFAGTRLRLR